jgi:hypothetical protein
VLTNVTVYWVVWRQRTSPRGRLAA